MALSLLGTCNNPASSTPSPVTYDRNGAESGSVPVDNERYATNGTVTVKGNMGNPARDGWTFIGWAKTREATTATTKYQARGTLPFEKSLALYAVWEWNIAGNKNWQSIAMLSDGWYLAAVDTVDVLGREGQIYTSSNSGKTWTNRSTAGTAQSNPIWSNKYWTSIAMSDNGDELAAGIGVGGTGHLYTSTDSGKTWTDRSE